MRRVITLNVSGHRLMATAHEPRGGSDIALVLLNAGPLPRAWDSGLPVDIGDRLAERGVSTFRFDLPGLGDTPGEVPELVEEFRLAINDGRNDDIVHEIAIELKAKFGLSRVVIGGLCAGAISSLRAAAKHPRQYAGLLMFEPDFRGPLPQRQAEQAGGAETPLPKPKLGMKAKLSKRFGRTQIEHAKWLGPARPALLWLMTKLVGQRLPKDVEHKLVHAWRHVVHARVPTLLVRAERGFDWRVRRILQSLPQRAVARSIRSVLVPQTNHMFTGGNGQAEALEAVLRWVDATYPERSPARSHEPAADEGSSVRAAKETRGQSA